MIGLLFQISLAAAGLCAGSFVTTAAIRWTRGEAFLIGRSHCEGCGTQLSFAATTPLASYFRTYGKAACCDQRIDPLHPVGELIGLAIMLSATVARSLSQGFALASMGFVLLALTVVDLRCRRLPDILVGATAVLALLLSGEDGRSRVIEGLAASALAFAVLESVRRGFMRLRGHAGLGGGDVKLITALAMWLGWMTPVAIAVASVLGLWQVALLRPKDGKIAFGPAIALAGFVVGLARLIWRFDL